jgi:hypothetical protein
MMKVIISTVCFLFILVWGNARRDLVKCQERNDIDGWIIHQTGAFDFEYHGLALKNCFPSIDGQTIRPRDINVVVTGERGRIDYKLTKGKLSLTLEKRNGSFTISAILEGWETAPDYIHPLASAEVSGANHFYRQGFGFAGPSGVIPIPQPIEKLKFSANLKENVWSYDSYLFTGLMSADNATVVISAFDHENYQHRCTLYNRQYRFGLIDRHKDIDQVFFESGFGTEEIRLPNKRLVLPTIYIQTGDDPYNTFQIQTKKLAAFNVVKLNNSPRYYFCSWYEFNKEFSEQILNEMLREMEMMKPKPEIQTIQIDDGYCWHGVWLKTNDKYPSGMKTVIKNIREHGYEAGIWIAPFMVSSNSYIFKDHHDWLLKDLTSKSILEWDQEEEDVYVLDSSHSEAFAYLRHVFRTFREMGVTSYKTDFMDWGLRDSKKVIRYSAGKTSVQYFTDVLKMIREEIGDESYWLSCISPYQPMVGFVDGMRLSNDVGVAWSDASTGNMFREMYAGQFFNNILWQNDPDVLYLRDYSVSLSERERQSIALWDGILGGTLTTSCRFNTLNDEALQLWSFLKPSDTHKSASLPFWGTPDSIMAAVREYPDLRSKAVLFVNPTQKSLNQNYSIHELSGMHQGFCFLWLPSRSESLGHLQDLKVRLEPHESVLIYISEENIPPSSSLCIAGN